MCSAGATGGKEKSVPPLRVVPPPTGWEGGEGALRRGAVGLFAKRPREKPAEPRAVPAPRESGKDAENAVSCHAGGYLRENPVATIYPPGGQERPTRKKRRRCRNRQGGRHAAEAKGVELHERCGAGLSAFLQKGLAKNQKDWHFPRKCAILAMGFSALPFPFLLILAAFRSFCYV